ncbi:MAG: FeoA family protein [Oscillospiraceae bacterium]|jgi:ferrous iron transport protein A
MKTQEIIPLSMLPVGKKCEVVSLSSSGIERRRMLDLGLIGGTSVEAVLKSPSGDPVAYYIRGAVIALRDNDAEKITVRYLC